MRFSIRIGLLLLHMIFAIILVIKYNKFYQLMIIIIIYQIFCILMIYWDEIFEEQKNEKMLKKEH